MATDIMLDVDNGRRLVLQGEEVAVDGVLKCETVAVTGVLNCEEANVNGVLNLKAIDRLPSNATPGDIFLVVKEEEGAMGLTFRATKLWLCVSPETPSVEGVPYWREIQLGPIVSGE